jgi:cell division protein FtsW
MKVATTTLLLSVAALLALGMVMLYSSSMADRGTHYLLMQIIWAAIGLVGLLSAGSMDYRLLKKFAWVLYALAFVLLALVLVPHIGVMIKGARRWFSLGRISFQPSELGKIALIAAVAWYGDRYQRQISDWRKGVVFPAIFIVPMLLLIFREPDRGTTILLAAVTAMMLVVAGVKWRYIALPSFIGAGLLALSLSFDQMRTKRIFAWLYLDEHKMDIGYQAYQAKLAFGAGGWTGLGLGDSREKLGFLPEHNTDFILPIVGEELGLIATLLVVLAFLLIVICGSYISFRASDTFGMLLGSGITFLIGLQAFINIGVVTSVLPNKGLALPFISYGGSNLLMMMCAVGLLVSIARRARVMESRRHKCRNAKPTNNLASGDCVRGHGGAFISRPGGGGAVEAARVRGHAAGVAEGSGSAGGEGGAGDAGGDVAGGGFGAGEPAGVCARICAVVSRGAEDF